MLEIEADKEKEYAITFKQMVKFVRDLGVDVFTNTKARGHQGFFLKNRIDISKNISNKRKIEVLIHEFTHYIHSKIDKSVYKNCGDLAILFPDSDYETIKKELYKVTRFVDTNQSLIKLEKQRAQVLDDIKHFDAKIKSVFPDFKRSYKYPKIEKEIKRTDAKYLLKYDRVKVKNIFPPKINEYSLDNIDEDFKELSQSAKDFIRLKSKQRLLNRISARINKLNNYYQKPCELFARFVEGLFIDTLNTANIAPYTYLVFSNQLANNKYLELADFINNFF